MRPRVALCGERKAHEPHPLNKILDDRTCPGMDAREAGAGELWRILYEYVADHSSWMRDPLPEGTTLLAHPSVPHFMMRALEPEFPADMGAEPRVFPPELPVILTTSLGEGEWRLVTISPVMGGILP